MRVFPIIICANKNSICTYSMMVSVYQQQFLRVGTCLFMNYFILNLEVIYFQEDSVQLDMLTNKRASSTIYNTATCVNTAILDYLDEVA